MWLSQLHDGDDARMTPDPAPRICTGEYSCTAREHTTACLFGRTPEMVHREAYTIIASSLLATATELAALKARRCDGCTWWRPDEQPSGWGTCDTDQPTDGPFIALALITAPDHACNAWTAREAQP